MLLNNIKKKKLIAFGASRTLRIAQKKLKIKLSYIIDNNNKLINKNFLNLKIFNPSKIKEEKNFVVIIYSPRFYEIKLQLEMYGLKYKKHFIHFLDLPIYKNLIDNLTDEICYKNLEHFLTPGNICLDIGANVGLYTYKMSKLVKSKGKVLSFEPVNIAFNQIKLLKKKYNLNNSQIFNFAIGDEKKETQMLIPVIDNLVQLGFSHIQTIKYKSKNIIKSKYNKVFYQKMNSGYKQKTTIELIDSIVLKLKLKMINYIKIDVEGFELKVIKGAIKSIKKFRPLIQTEIFYSKDNQKKLLSYFKSIEYSFFYPNKKKIIRIHNWKTINGVGNYYLIPKEKLNFFINKFNNNKYNSPKFIDKYE